MVLPRSVVTAATRLGTHFFCRMPLGSGRVHPVARVPHEFVDERGRGPEDAEHPVPPGSPAQQFLGEPAKVCQVALSRQGLEDADESEQRLVGIGGVADGLEQTVRQPVARVAAEDGQGEVGEVAGGPVRLGEAEPGESPVVEVVRDIPVPAARRFRGEQVAVELEARHVVPIVLPLLPLVAREEVEDVLAEDVGDELALLHLLDGQSRATPAAA